MSRWRLLKFMKDLEVLHMRRAMVAGAANTRCQTQPGQVVATQIACQGDACYAVPIRGTV
jgi:hypothetical protein